MITHNGAEKYKRLCNGLPGSCFVSVGIRFVDCFVSSFSFFIMVSLVTGSRLLISKTNTTKKKNRRTKKNKKKGEGKGRGKGRRGRQTKLTTIQN